MKTAHVNIPVFIPHLGCPNMCVFCNQRAISGVCSFIPERAKETIDTVLATTEGKSREIAYFGGSFTGIERDWMIRLLDLAETYVRGGSVTGIRLSTRPDYINDEIIEILSRYTIAAVELGIQSFSDAVLAESRRGHTAEDSVCAMTMLRQAGFSVVGQMMIGLPASTAEAEIETARQIAAYGASAARIYPTVVFRETELFEQMRAGKYVPLTLEEAVERSAAVLDVFERAGIPCLRIGLCESENLHHDAAAGPNHPALGELVYSELYYRRITEKLGEITVPAGKTIIIEVPTGDLSQAIGQKKRNKNRILAKYPKVHIKFLENPRLMRYNISFTITEQVTYAAKNKSDGKEGSHHCT